MVKAKPELNSVHHIVPMRPKQAKLVLFICTVLCAGIWIFTLNRIDSERDQAIASQLASNSVLAQTQEGRISNALQVFDQILLVIRDDFLTHGKPQSIEQRLKALHVDRTYVGIVTLIDETGNVIATTADDMKVNFADREYFKEHASDQADRLLIGKPIIGRKTGKSIISLTRRIYHPNGSFAGVVFLALDPVFLAPDYSNVKLSKDVTITLVGLDGIVRVRHINGTNSFGEDVRAGKLLEEVRNSEVGNLISVTPIDGRRRATSYRKLPNYPLIVLVGSPVEQVADSLKGNERIYFLSAVLGSLVLIGFAFAVNAAFARSRQQFEEASSKAERMRGIIDASPVPMALNDSDARITFLNRAFTETYGYAPEDIPTLDSWWRSAYPDPMYRSWVIKTWGEEVNRAECTGTQFTPMEIKLQCKDGREKIAVASAARFSTDQDAEHLVVLFDITERKQAQEKLQLAAGVFTHALEGIVITAPDATIIDVNDAFTRITGHSREDAIGRNPRFLSSGRHDQSFYAAMWSALTEHGRWNGEIWNRRKDGAVFAESLTISSVKDDLGNTLRYIALFSDITASKEHQSQLEHIAHFDALTNLPNRALLADRLQQAMAQAQRRQKQVAVAYLDLDGFKAINDRHGHVTGDQVLITLANRMKNTLREGDTLARIGGDEFVAVLIDLEDTSASVPMVIRLLAAAALPVHVGDLTAQASASVGVTFYPQAQDIDADQLLRQADQAMYQAKVAGKNRFSVFDAEHDSSLRDHHESLERIRQALENHEFVLYYQPKVNMRSGQVIGAEALIRWQHPEKGLLAPAAFLPAIEDDPLAVAVGEWVINTALNQIERWRADALDVPVSVNIGALQLQQGNFFERLKGILAHHPQVNPARLELEVLETSALADMAQVSQIIEDCAQIGVTFALDDFGTGYSSLTYLKSLRVTLLKIDQSFVRDMLEDPDDLAILQGVIGLAAAFSRKVIAEGVETVEHGTALLHLGCELAQGYGIARPMPAEQMPAWVASWQPDDAWSELPWLGGNT